LLTSLSAALLGVLDRVLFRRPFEGLAALVYRTRTRPAFEDFDERLLAHLAAPARSAQRLLEVGAGPATFARAAKRRFPHLEVIAVEPSRQLARAAAAAGRQERPAAPVAVVRALAEELPLRDASISLAVCVSSIRHVADRRRAFAELRRVLVPGGALIIAELDPAASAARIAHHADRLGSRWLRASFGPLVVRTAPPWQAIAAAARRAGFDLVRYAEDPLQPLYLLDLR
jgi:ubiquinone/menaquinone biosynthesis C-methylase UbiE